MRRRQHGSLALVVTVAALCTVTSRGDPLGPGFTYQGRLTQNGQPVNGSVNLAFFLYDAATGGTQIGSPVTLSNHGVQNGLFTAVLNQAGQFGPDAFNGERRWLWIWVNGVPLLPRQELTATPNALFAVNAPWSGLIGVPDVALLSSAQTFTAPQTFSVGVTTNAFRLSTSPQAGYVLTSDASGNGSWRPAQVPVPLTVSGSQSSGPIITGQNTAPSGASIGLLGEVSSTSGSAIGISGRTVNGVAIKGEATGTSGINVGVSAVTESPNGFAVYGVAHSTGTGSAYGGYFESRNTSGAIAVYGQTTFASTGDVAGWFRSQGTDGRGVIGMALGSGSVRGVWGQVNSPSGFGVYSSGNLHIVGNLTATGSKTGYVADVVKNGGHEALQIGDVVEIVGHDVPVLGDIPVIVVRKAQREQSRAVLGPVAFAVEVTANESYEAEVAALPEDCPHWMLPCRFHVHRVDGELAPGSYGQVVTLGSFAAIKVDASIRPVKVGDLLVSSSLPGYAMATDSPDSGTMIGKALGSLVSGTGTIPVFVSPR